jgi:site-specific recombinase XerD
MTTLPSIIESKQEILSNQDLVNLAFDFAARSSSINTKRTYKYGWKSFNNWCKARGVDPLLNESKEALIAFYVSEQAAGGKLKVSSITCYLAGIREHYQEHGIVINLQHPTIQKVLKGVRNTLFKRPLQKEPLLIDQIKEMVEGISIEKNGKLHLIGIRDRAILLLGFAGAFRRSELVSLDIDLYERWLCCSCTEIQNRSRR